LGTAAAPTLAAAWTFSTAAHGDMGNLQSTPIVHDGCAFIASTSGIVYAINAATGAEVWQHQLSVVTPGSSGDVVGALATTAGHIIALVNQAGDGINGPYVAALDEQSGSPVWTSSPITTLSGYYTNASAQVFNGVVFAGFSPPEGQNGATGGFGLIDAGTGLLLTVTPTIPLSRQAQGFAGGGIWSTPAFDPATGFAYVGAGNPYSKTQEDQNTNAILKIDLRPKSPTFGAIVAAYKGNVDQYTQALQQLSQTPACAASQSAPSPLDDPVCGQLDLDFGASPNLFVDAGHLVVGDLQKSGVYHAADATSMAPVWNTIVGGSCLVCNAASTAVADGSVFGEATPGGVAFALSQADGTRQSATAVSDGIHYEATSTADGVVYTADTTGFLDAFDAATGLPLLRHPMALDTGAPTANLTADGIAIAYHTLYATASEGSGSGSNSGGFLIAYR
ncbi:MAG: PQQ-binding-like beta-propeller repeat protein, partial [Candidatus Dormibacteria bacterium]